MTTLNTKLVNTLTGKDLKTVLNPLTVIKDEITFSTDKYFRLHSYIIPLKKVDFTRDDGVILAKLPKKSNIADFEPSLDKIKERIKGEKYKAPHDDHSKDMWVDRFNRSIGTKIETPDRILFTLRADIANDLFLEGNAMIQCAEVSCSIFMPTKISADMKEFGMKDVKK